MISSGLERSSLSYSKAAFLANCCFVNCTPSVIACDNDLRNEFFNSGLVLVGDDLMSQFGGTVLHKGLLDLMDQRGIKTVKSYQLDVGGGMDTLNTIEEKVKLEKRKIKSNSISLELPYEFKTAAGTTDFVEFMNNNRTSYYWIQGLNYLGSNIYLDVYLRTVDGTNSGNILLDTIRSVKKAKDNGDFGTPLDICGYGFKKIPKPTKFRKVYDIFEKNYLKF
jgi:myo-inositol-1-phosphate synthase